MDTLSPLIAYLDSCENQASLSVLEQLLLKADVSSDTVAKFQKFSDETYTRNSISRSDYYELLLICWKPGQQSQIHDHQGSSCAFKVIEGTATEEVFTLQPSGGVILSAERQYINGHICVAQTSDIHRISNRVSNSNLMTLHIYSPPLSMTTYTVEAPSTGRNQSA